MGEQEMGALQRTLEERRGEETMEPLGGRGERSRFATTLSTTSPFASTLYSPVNFIPFRILDPNEGLALTNLARMRKEKKKKADNILVTSGPTADIWTSLYRTLEINKMDQPVII